MTNEIIFKATKKSVEMIVDQFDWGGVVPGGDKIELAVNFKLDELHSIMKYDKVTHHEFVKHCNAGCEEIKSELQRMRRKFLRQK